MTYILNITPTHRQTDTHTHTYPFNAKEFIHAHSYTVYYSNQLQNKWRKSRLFLNAMFHIFRTSKLVHIK